MWLPFVGNTYQFAKLASAKNGQYLALEDLRNRYKSNVIGLKLGSGYVVVAFGDVLLKDTFHREEFQGRPDTFFLKLRTLGKRLGNYNSFAALISYDYRSYCPSLQIVRAVALEYRALLVSTQN